MTAADSADVFERQRGALSGLAYRMLASRSEAEDVVQDAFLRWAGRKEAGVDDPRSYLAAIVTRLCLDRMKSARARREVYVGPWLPEPVVDEALDAESAGELAHDLSVALMMALERLSPLERAAFLLHDVFEIDFAEVAQNLGRSEAACRQLAARARRHVRSDRPRFPANQEEGRRLAVAFEAAARSGDAAALTELLTADAVLYSDGGGKRPAALRPINGAEDIAHLLTSVIARGSPLASTRPAIVNGLAGFVLREQDGPVSTVAFETRDGRISAIYFVRNPDKLGHVRF
jgi:RNA polymerase sigma-70 factor (ECF subfamily)